jgi:DNA-binding NarL/FixJ family response regulator
VTADLAQELVPIAAQLVATVRDYGPDDVKAILARVPDGRHDALAIVLAAMVDPDERPSKLLAWTEAGPVQSRDFTPPGYDMRGLTQSALGRHAERRKEVGRLTNLGYSTQEISDRLGITTRAVVRHRAAIRAGLESAS